MSFSVSGQNVTVVGAARSGIAAALLLAERGARVTLTDARPELEPLAAVSCATQASTIELGGHRRETFTSADLMVLSPGVPLDQPAIVAARRAGVPSDGRDRAGVALAERTHRGDHRHARASRRRPP